MSATQLTVDGARQLLAYSRESADRLLALYGQEEEIASWAERHGYEIAGYERDNQIQGIVPADDREGLSAALSALQGPTGGLVVSHLDRIARSVPVMLDTVQRIWDAGRDLFAVHLPARLAHWYGKIPRTAEGWEFCRYVAEHAAYELELLKQRLYSARRRKGAAGGYTGGPRFGRRYGDELIDGDYRPIPAEQAVIRRVCYQHAEGFGYLKIANALNRERVATVSGRPWTPKVIRDLVLRGPAVSAPVVPPRRVR